jgi:hypothetical protein
MNFVSHHPLPKDAQQFLENCEPKERELHQLAADMLKSSYFMEKTHSYRKWKSAQNLQKNVTIK